MSDRPMSIADAAHAPSVPGYRTGRLLGFGGSGEVWAATSESTGAPVALKVARPAADRAAFRHEAALLQRIDHPHIVRTLGLVDADDGSVLILERATGGSLAALVGARGPLDVGEVVTLLTSLAGALADLHSRGLVHGDVAPGNVLFADDARPLLGDLGAAALTGVPAERSATPGFADPPTAGRPEGDVAALAAVGWFALTGLPPGPLGERAPLGTLLPTCPDALVALLTDALAPALARRPDAAAFAVACFEAAPAEPVRLVATDPDAPAGEVVTHRLRSAATGPRAVSADVPARRRTPKGWPVVVVALGLLVPLVAGLVVAAGAGLGGWSTPAAPAVGAAPAGGDPVAPDPVAAVRTLAALRAQGFSSGDPAPLEQASVAGSSALAADLALLEQMQQAGVVLAGLTFDVTDAQVLEAERAEALVWVQVATGAHRQVRAGSAPTEVPVAAPTARRLLLRLVDGAWRVASVHPGGSPPA